MDCTHKKINFILAMVKKCGIIIMYIENFIIRMFENTDEDKEIVLNTFE